MEITGQGHILSSSAWAVDESAHSRLLFSGLISQIHTNERGAEVAHQGSALSDTRLCLKKNKSKRFYRDGGSLRSCHYSVVVKRGVVSIEESILPVQRVDSSDVSRRFDLHWKWCILDALGSPRSPLPGD